LTRLSANKRRKLVLTPDYNNQESEQSEACADLSDMNFAQFVGWGELKGCIHGPRLAYERFYKPDRFFGYFDFAGVTFTSTIMNRVADHVV